MSRHAYRFYGVLFLLLLVTVIVQYSLPPQPEVRVDSHKQPFDVEFAEPVDVSTSKDSTEYATVDAKRIEKESAIPPTSLELNSVSASSIDINRANAAQIHATIDDFKQRMDTESIDQSWAYRRQTEINDVFINDERLRDLKLKSVDCREALCQINLSSQPTIGRFTAMMQVQRALVAAPWYQSHMRSAMGGDSDADHDGDWVIYLSR